MPDFAGISSLIFSISAVFFCNDCMFVLGSEVSIHFGYKDDTYEVFAGEVTGFAPQLDEIIISKKYLIKFSINIVVEWKIFS